MSFYVLLSTQYLAAVVYEIHFMDEARPYTLEKPKTLVCFDVDGTLIRPRTNGPENPDWVAALARYAADNGLKEFPAWGWPEHEPIYQRIEDAAPALVQELQARGIPAVVLTARAPESWLATDHELQQAGFNFSAGILGKLDQLFILHWNDALLTHGMLLTGTPHKCFALSALLNIFAPPAERVVCIDDCLEVLIHMDYWFASRPVIEYIGLHYRHIERTPTQQIEIPQSFKDAVAEQCARKQATQEGPKN